MDRSKNFKIDVSKRVFSLVIAVVIGVFCSVSVFADITFTELPVVSSSTVSTDGSIIYNDGTNIFRAGASESGVFLCVMKWGSQSQYQHIQAYCKDLTTADVWVDMPGFNWYNQWTYDSTRDQYFRESATEVPSNFNAYTIPVFNNGKAAADAFQEFTPSPSPNPDAGNALNVSLPAGNAIFIEVGGGSNQYILNMRTRYPGPQITQNVDGKKIGWYSDIPATISSRMSGVTDINATGVGNPNWYGAYEYYQHRGDVALNVDADKYLCVINPLFPNNTDDTANPCFDIDITVEKVVSYVIYPLQTTIQGSDAIGNNNGTSYIEGTYDEDTEQWTNTNQDGEAQNPSFGGNTSPPEQHNTINDFLQNIASQISSFFSGAIGAINTLVGAVSDFAGTLKALYVWLPSPVYSVLTAAIILAITIGVIKVFI